MSTQQQHTKRQKKSDFIEEDFPKQTLKELPVIEGVTLHWPDVFQNGYGTHSTASLQAARASQKDRPDISLKSTEKPEERDVAEILVTIGNQKSSNDTYCQDGSRYSKQAIQYQDQYQDYIQNDLASNLLLCPQRVAPHHVA